MHFKLDECNGDIGSAVIKLRSAIENKGLKHRYLSFYGKSGLLENLFFILSVDIIFMILYEYQNRDFYGAISVIVSIAVLRVLYVYSLKFKKQSFNEIINKSKAYSSGYAMNEEQRPPSTPDES